MMAEMEGKREKKSSARAASDEALQEKRIALTKTIGGYLSAMTLRHNEIENSLQSQDLQTAQTALESMRITFAKFEADMFALMSLHRERSDTYEELSEKLAKAQERMNRAISNVSDLALRNVSATKQPSVAGSVQSHSSKSSKAAAQAIAKARLEGLKAKEAYLNSPEVQQKKIDAQLEAQRLAIEAREREKKVEASINLQAEIKQAEAEVENLEQDGETSSKYGSIDDTNFDERGLLTGPTESTQNQPTLPAPAGSGGGFMNYVKGFFTPRNTNVKNKVVLPSTIQPKPELKNVHTKSHVKSHRSERVLNPEAVPFETCTPTATGNVSRPRKISFDLEKHVDSELYKKCPSCNLHVNAKCSLCPECGVDFAGRSVLGGSTLLETTALDPLLKLQTKMLDTLTLPTSTLIQFDGDPLKFHLFFTRFDAVVDKKEVDAGNKLNLLTQYCIGRASGSIRACSSMKPPETAYKRAREILFDRFGDPHTIATAHVENITKCSVIKNYDGEALRSFADQVRNCYETMNALDMLSEISNKRTMIEVVTRLPTTVIGRWQTESQKYKKKHKGVYPKFIFLVEFIEDEAKRATDSVYGSNLYSKDSRGKGQQRSSSTSMNTSGDKVNSQQNNGGNKSGGGSASGGPSGQSGGSGSRPPGGFKCRYPGCGQTHTLVKCDKFAALSPAKRLQFVKDNYLCFLCLRGDGNHRAQTCQAPRICTKGDCNKNRLHNPLLHDALVPKKPAFLGNINSDDTSRVSLPIVRVSVRVPNGQREVEVLCALDNFSDKTYCTTELINYLRLQGKKLDMNVRTMTGEGRDRYEVVTLEVKGLRKIHLPITLTPVHATNKFPKITPVSTVNCDIEDVTPEFVRNAPLDTSHGKVHLLIGQDHPLALCPRRVVESFPGGPFAVETRLGWQINGPIIAESPDVASNWATSFTCMTDPLDRQVEKFFKLDGPEVLISKQEMSQNDRKVEAFWNANVRMVDGHYEIPIPFKAVKVEFPDNRHTAVVRLASLRKRLLSDPEWRRMYVEAMEKMITLGFVERVPMNCNPPKGGVWYIPHHGVTHPYKIGVIRPVFDCASVTDGVSLNNSVHSGPDYMNKLLGVLLRFSESPVAVMGDIHAMFHMAFIPSSQRDFLRYFWWPGGDLHAEPVEYRFTRHLFGGVWSPSAAAYCLRRTAQDNENDFSREVLDTVRRHIYVDDALKSVLDSGTAINLIKDLTELLNRGGFHMTKWMSNCHDVVMSVPPEDRASEVKSLDFDMELPIDRALGTKWDAQTDEFFIKIKQKSEPSTRRGLLSVTSSVFDPRGFANPTTLQAKLIFQHETRLKKDWDAPLEEENQKAFASWLRNLIDLESLRIPRVFVPGGLHGMTIQVHIFCDAGEAAYGAVSYLRAVDPSGNIHVSFLLGKSRLAPLKFLSIPKLELTAAVEAVKMNNTVCYELSFDPTKSYFWTDSMTVLQYIKNKVRRFYTFVANRVNIILESSEAL